MNWIKRVAYPFLSFQAFSSFQASSEKYELFPVHCFPSSYSPGKKVLNFDPMAMVDSSNS